jgi:hypothetical protein
MHNDIKEVIVEGLTVEDFNIILQLIESYPITIVDPKLQHIQSLHQKIQHLVDYVNKE